jgi:hypothetical protein
MPARHTSLQRGLLLEADFKLPALVDERGCRRDIRSNGWIVLAMGSPFARTGPAEETSFLRSVRVSRDSQFHRLPSLKPALRPEVKSDPDVFADALVPLSRRRCPALPISQILIPATDAFVHGGGGHAGRDCPDGYRFAKRHGKPKSAKPRNPR